MVLRNFSPESTNMAPKPSSGLWPSNVQLWIRPLLFLSSFIFAHTRSHLTLNLYVDIYIYLYLFVLSSLSFLTFCLTHGSSSIHLRHMHCSLLWLGICYFQSQAPKLKGLYYPGKLGQCTNAHFPRACLCSK